MNKGNRNKDKRYKLGANGISQDGRVCDDRFIHSVNFERYVLQQLDLIHGDIALIAKALIGGGDGQEGT